MLPALPPFMQLAFEEARAAAARQEVPVGAVVTAANGTVIGAAGNRTIELHDPTAHAEILAIRQAAAALGSERLTDCVIHVTLEPCAMCAAAISLARLKRVVFAADDPKMGAIDHGPRFFTQASCHHKPEVISGIGSEQAKELLQQFFRERR